MQAGKMGSYSMQDRKMGRALNVGEGQLYDVVAFEKKNTNWLLSTWRDTWFENGWLLKGKIEVIFCKLKGWPRREEIRCRLTGHRLSR